MKPWWFIAAAIAAAVMASVDMARNAGAPGLPEGEPGATRPAGPPASSTPASDN